VLTINLAITPKSSHASIPSWRPRQGRERTDDLAGRARPGHFRPLPRPFRQALHAESGSGRGWVAGRARWSFLWPLLHPPLDGVEGPWAALPYLTGDGREGQRTGRALDQQIGYMPTFLPVSLRLGAAAARLDAGTDCVVRFLPDRRQRHHDDRARGLLVEGERHVLHPGVPHILAPGGRAQTGLPVQARRPADAQGLGFDRRRGRRARATLRMGDG
jgi:hypothetical protein